MAIHSHTPSRILLTDAEKRDLDELYARAEEKWGASQARECFDTAIYSAGLWHMARERRVQ